MCAHALGAIDQNDDIGPAFALEEEAKLGKQDNEREQQQAEAHADERPEWPGRRTALARHADPRGDAFEAVDADRKRRRGDD